MLTARHTKYDKNKETPTVLPCSKNLALYPYSATDPTKPATTKGVALRRRVNSMFFQAKWAEKNEMRMQIQPAR